MRISNLIDALTKIKEKYGDLRVGVSDREGEACGCETVVHEEERWRCVSHEEALFSNAYGSPEVVDDFYNSGKMFVEPTEGTENVLLLKIGGYHQTWED